MHGVVWCGVYVTSQVAGMLQRTWSEMQWFRGMDCSAVVHCSTAAAAAAAGERTSGKC